METYLNKVSPIIFSPTITLRTQNDYLIIPIDKIIFCEADGSYSKIFFEDGAEVVVSKSLIVLERCLDNSNFIRCHNSYLVNAPKITKYNKKNKILNVLGYKIPVSRRKCRNTMMKLKGLTYQL